MNRGRLDRLITIEQPTTATDEYGSKGATSWASLASVWAKMDTSISNESVSSDKVENTYPVKWLVNYTSTIKSNMRVVYESEDYYIKGIREIGRRRFLELQTELKT